MESTTRERILEAALVSFAENGYKGTNLRELAAGMGLSKSALYKHYAGKEEIWNAMIDEMEAYYETRFGSLRNLPAIPRRATELKTLTMRMLRFTLYDKKVILTRKLLLTEQFRDERIRTLATEHFSTGLESLYTEIFARMMENGSLQRGDAAMLAFAYTAPIASLVHLADREPEKLPEIMAKTESFVQYFIDTYGKGQT